ncbi:hypothetical protein Tco_0445922 [Tanacetum coccineum]
MESKPSRWDNGLRICFEDVIEKVGQKHGKWHGTFAFLYDFLHSINNHRSEVEHSFNGYVVKHDQRICFWDDRQENLVTICLSRRFLERVEFEGFKRVKMGFVKSEKRLEAYSLKNGSILFLEMKDGATILPSWKRHFSIVR